MLCNNSLGACIFVCPLVLGPHARRRGAGGGSPDLACLGGPGRGGVCRAALTKNMSALECPVCLEPFDEIERAPKILPCGGNHELCEACLKLFRPNRSASFQCPECREIIPGDVRINSNRGLLAALAAQAALAAVQAAQQAAAPASAPVEIGSPSGHGMALQEAQGASTAVVDPVGRFIPDASPAVALASVTADRQQRAAPAPLPPPAFVPQPMGLSPNGFGGFPDTRAHLPVAGNELEGELPPLQRALTWPTEVPDASYALPMHVTAMPPLSQPPLSRSHLPYPHQMSAMSNEQRPHMPVAMSLPPHEQQPHMPVAVGAMSYEQQPHVQGAMAKQGQQGGRTLQRALTTPLQTRLHVSAPAFVPSRAAYPGQMHLPPTHVSTPYSPMSHLSPPHLPMGRLVAMAKEQEGSRTLQRALTSMSPVRLQAACDELGPHLGELATHLFGNYLVSSMVHRTAHRMYLASAMHVWGWRLVDDVLARASHCPRLKPCMMSPVHTRFDWLPCALCASGQLARSATGDGDGAARPRRGADDACAGLTSGAGGDRCVAIEGRPRTCW